MADHSVRFSFVKLQVEDMAGALAFWQAAFGFAVRGTYDEPTFFEHILTIPGDSKGTEHLTETVNQQNKL